MDGALVAELLFESRCRAQTRSAAPHRTACHSAPCFWCGAGAVAEASVSAGAGRHGREVLLCGVVGSSWVGVSSGLLSMQVHADPHRPPPTRTDPHPTRSHRAPSARQAHTEPHAPARTRSVKRQSSDSTCSRQFKCVGTPLTSPLDYLGMSEVFVMPSGEWFNRGTGCDVQTAKSPGTAAQGSGPTGSDCAEPAVMLLTTRSLARTG